MIEPKKLPSGAATVMAKALPPFKSPNALGTWLKGTNRITIAVEMAQKPPMTIPSKARPVINNTALCAKVTKRPEIIIRMVKARIT